MTDDVAYPSVIACILLGACMLAFQPSPALAATPVPCPDVSTIGPGGEALQAVGVEASGVDCQLVDRVVREFYAQPVGSSGATYVHGFGCAYHGGMSVECGPGASGSDGSERIRWREQRNTSTNGTLPARTCGTLPGQGAYSYIKARGMTCRQAGKIAYRVRRRFCARRNLCRQGPPLRSIRTYRGRIAYRGWRCHVTQSWELDVVRCRHGKRHFLKKSAA